MSNSLADDGESQENGLCKSGPREIDTPARRYRSDPGQLAKIDQALCRYKQKDSMPYQ